MILYMRSTGENLSGDEVLDPMFDDDMEIVELRARLFPHDEDEYIDDDMINPEYES